jgi:mitochondrial fission protein ELM1
VGPDTNSNNAANPQRRPNRPLIVWRFIDGKPGHEQQSLGLVNALSELLPVVVRQLAVRGGLRDWLGALTGRCRTAATSRPAGMATEPPPDLLIGAGHATHAAMLACRRRRGGRIVVLMRPSVPLRWFDLCVVPQHDGIAASDRVLLTRGVLNAMRPAAHKDPNLGLILVGGPSAHYDWDAPALCGQIGKILQRDHRRWIVATSRRTPQETLQALRVIANGDLAIVPHEQTAPGWLAGQLQPAAAAWVTEDSVSMLYEALTAGAACGVLPVPRRRAGRVRAGLDGLLADGTVTSFEAWQRNGRLAAPSQPLNEAARCARWIRDRWFAA